MSRERILRSHGLNTETAVFRSQRLFRVYSASDRGFSARICPHSFLVALMHRLLCLCCLPPQYLDDSKPKLLTKMHPSFARIPEVSRNFIRAQERAASCSSSINSTRSSTSIEHAGIGFRCDLHTTNPVYYRASILQKAVFDFTIQPKGTVDQAVPRNKKEDGKSALSGMLKHMRESDRAYKASMAFAKPSLNGSNLQ